MYVYIEQQKQLADDDEVYDTILIEPPLIDDDEVDATLATEQHILDDEVERILDDMEVIDEVEFL